MFGVLTVGAVASLLTLGLIRVGVRGAVPSPDELLPFLIAAASLCVFGLTVRRRPAIAWLALIGCVATITIDLAAFGRAQRPVVPAETWRWIALVIVLAAILSTSAAAAYAAHPAHRFRSWMPVFGVVAVLFVFAVGAWALATPDPIVGLDDASTLGDLGLVTRAFLITTVTLTLLTALGELRPAAKRASRRLAITGAGRRYSDGPIGYAAAWFPAFVEELSPGKEQARRAADAERARLARDLHAVVVPDLRRALDEAERAGSVDRLAGSLRDALQQVEAMMGSRDAIGLDIGGLVPALESLAERTEERSDVRVTIDVTEDTAGSAGAPPREVEAAALRVATLALDNVTRHAPAATVRLAVTRQAGCVHLAIEDSGPGVHVDRAAGPAGRGLADMATEAALCGASVRSELGNGGLGTLIAFDWPAA